MANFHAAGRFYDAEYPEVDELVVVQVLKVDDKAGAYVTLQEYDNKEGMINLSEISKRRIRSMVKILRVGSTEICMVVSVDPDKGYINLSKKRVASEDCGPKQEAFAKAKAIHGVMQHVAMTNKIPVEELCSKVSWPLNVEFPSAYSAFKKHINDELKIWDHVDFSQPGMDLSEQQEKLKADIETVLQRRLMSSTLRLQAKCEVACSEYEGIDAVKAALKTGFEASKPDCEVLIKLIAHPVFALSCVCKEKEVGIAILDEAMEKIEKAIVAAKGTFALKSKPTIFQKAEDAEEDDKDKDSDSEDGSSSSDGEPEDETMGDFKADFSDLMKKKVDKDEDEDDD